MINANKTIIELQLLVHIRVLVQYRTFNKRHRKNAAEQKAATPQKEPSKTERSIFLDSLSFPTADFSRRLKFVYNSWEIKS
jgi:hypothetical protein